MRFNKHYNVEGTHAILSCSQNSWIRKTDEEFDEWISNSKAAEEGTELHAIAAKLIKKRIRLPDDQATLNMYVNDAIGFRMTPEQPLYYSPNCFGTADTISFSKNFLRIHDLKTGETDTSFNQLKVYAALFCLEYRYKPEELDGIELRIYQNNDVRVLNPDAIDIQRIMDTIVQFDRQIEKLKMEE